MAFKDPNPFQPPTRFMNNSTRASLPGRIEVQPLLWLRCFALLQLVFSIPLILLVLGSLIVIFIGETDKAALPILPILVLIMMGRRLYMAFLRVSEKVNHGCLNPAVVVSVAPYLIAVYSDLTMNDRDHYPVIKILKQPLNRSPAGRALKVGDRLPTVAIYRWNPDRSRPYWSDFHPIAVPCVNSDPPVIAQAIKRLDLDEGGTLWYRLQAGLKLIPTPTVPGLYFLTPAIADSGPGRLPEPDFSL